MSVMKLIVVALSICFASVCLAQTTIAVPSTGQACTSDGHDANWRIVSSTIPEEAGTGQAFCVTTLSEPLARPAPGTSWIGPGPDQANVQASAGTVTYAINFNVNDLTAALQMNINGDEDFKIILNGMPVYSSSGPTYAAAVLVNLTSGFMSGQNTLQIQVTSSGGSNGVYVNIPQPAPPPAGTFYPDIKPPSRYGGIASPEPIDGATGQYYDVFHDLDLGGPLRLGFKRYYSSQLSATGYSAALGRNWMHNFDLGLKASATTAQVLLFRGLVVKFTAGSGSWKLVSPNNVPYQLLQSGSGFRFVDPAAELFYSFDSSGALTSIADRLGNAITVTPGPNGPTRASWGPHNLTFIYAGKQLTSVRDETGREVRFAYTGALLTSFTGVDQQMYTYTYTTAGSLTGLMTKKQLPMGEVPTTQTYDSTGRVLTQTDSNNNALKIAYDGSGGTTITDPQGVTGQSANSNGDLIQTKDTLGVTLKHTYDASFRQTGTTDRAGNSMSVTYDAASGFTTSRADPLGNKTSFSYTAQTQNGASFYELAGITHADGAKTAFSYNPSGQLTSTTMRDGTLRSYAYDQSGRLTSVTRPNGGVTSFTYNPDFTPASMQDALGNQTNYSYDANSRLSRIVDPNGSAVSFSYDARGALTSFTNENGVTLSATFDADGRLASRTNPYGGRTAYTWTADGNLAAYADSLGNPRRYTYDSLHRLSNYTNALGQTVRFTRDRAGHVLSIADDAGTRATYTYNGEGRRTSFRDALGRTWKYTIDVMGRRSAMTTPLGNAVSFSYDSLGRMTAVKDALGQSSTVQYDAMGRVAQVQSAGGLTTSIARNSLGLATSITDPNGNAWTRDYDKIGRLATRTDPLGNQTTYTYAGTRLSSVTMPTGTLSIGVDPAGRITKRQYSDGTTLNYSYDPRGRIATADGVAVQRDARGQITASNGITIGRDPLGRITSMAYADGKTITYTYNDSGKLAQIGDWAGGVTTFGYDAAGEMTSMQRANGLASNYDYDADGRIVHMTTGSLASISLTRDAGGHVTSADRNLPLAPALPDSADSFAYDAASQLTAATYDASGHVTAQGTRTYAWDGASRLTSFTDPSTISASLTYDALGEVASMTTVSSTRSFAFNYAVKLPALSVVRQDGADLRYYVYLPDGRLLYSIEAADDTRHFYHFDEAGNTAFLTDDGANITDSYAITPFGEVLNHSGTSDNPFTFQGQYGVIQEAPGLFYMRSRHYDAATARFLSRDTVSVTDPRGVAPYSYARDNPMLYTDPLGNGWGFGDFFSAIGNGIQAAGHAVVGAAEAVGNAAVSAVDAVEDTIFPPETPAVQPADDSYSDDSTDAAVEPEDPSTDQADGDPPYPDLTFPDLAIQADVQTAVDPASTLDAAAEEANATQSVLAPSATDIAGQCPNTGLIGNDGSSAVPPSAILSEDGVGVVSHDAGGLIGNDGSSVVSHDAGGLIGAGGSTFTRAATSALLSTNSGT